MGEESHGRINLFDYTEEQLLKNHELTYYEILHIAEFASSDAVKRAYRKTSLKYHPDKTGRDDDDYVFLAVKAAYDTLFDPAKRQAYDSTTMPFDESIPPLRSALVQDPMLLYKDEDFYETFGPVFKRNLRFDARLRPELSKKNHSKRKMPKHQAPPLLGDADTALHDVHKFYEYWIHFESWRDFSSVAAEELQVQVDDVESRFEKRYLQKEIDKRAKQLKKQEMGRIQTLVERAMDADPRLRKERQKLVEEKERSAREREEERQRQEAEADAARQRAEVESKERLEREAAEKIARDEYKTLLREQRIRLRNWTATAFEKHRTVWEDGYELKQDVDYLCSSLALVDLRSLNDECEAKSEEVAMRHAKELASERLKLDNHEPADNANEPKPECAPSRNSEPTSKPWSKDELSALAKAVKKYPPGGSSRWEQITLSVNNLCKTSRLKEECIEKFNQLARKTPFEPPTPTTSFDESSWTAEQDQQLQNALAKFPASMDKNERWTSISNAVPGKSKKDCVQRFKAIRDALKNKK